MQQWYKEKAIFRKLLKYAVVPPYTRTQPFTKLPENVIWSMWMQGEENAPDIVKICLHSIRVQNPHRKVIVLNDTNLNNYLLLPEYLIRKYKSGLITPTQYSDIIRLFILTTYGGTWMDATIFQCGRIPQKIEESTLFMYTNPAWHHLKCPTNESMIYFLGGSKNLPPYHCFSSWFIHAKKNNLYLCKLLHMMLCYWQENDTLINYFLLHYMGSIALCGDVECRQIFEHLLFYQRSAAYTLYSFLQKRISDDDYNELLYLSPIHKLTYKYDKEKPIVADSVLERLYKQYGDELGLTKKQI